jgi:3-carboxy-cis,cis-muconate cycloisomerase
LEAASRRAVSEGQHLRDLLLADREVTVHLRPDEIQRLFDPLACTGAADDFIQRVLDESRGWAQGEGS